MPTVCLYQCIPLWDAAAYKIFCIRLKNVCMITKIHLTRTMKALVFTTRNDNSNDCRKDGVLQSLKSWTVKDLSYITMQCLMLTVHYQHSVQAWATIQMKIFWVITAVKFPTVTLHTLCLRSVVKGGLELIRLFWKTIKLFRTFRSHFTEHNSSIYAQISIHQNHAFLWLQSIVECNLFI